MYILVIIITNFAFLIKNEIVLNEAIAFLTKSYINNIFVTFLIVMLFIFKFFKKRWPGRRSSIFDGSSSFAWRSRARGHSPIEWRRSLGSSRLFIPEIAFRTSFYLAKRWIFKPVAGAGEIFRSVERKRDQGLVTINPQDDKIFLLQVLDFTNRSMAGIWRAWSSENF